MLAVLDDMLPLFPAKLDKLRMRYHCRSYLKEDSCNAPKDHTTAFEQYGRMRDALNATNRSIFFSLWGWEEWYAPEGPKLGNSWRVGPDDSNWAGTYERQPTSAHCSAH